MAEACNALEDIRFIDGDMQVVSMEGLVAGYLHVGGGGNLVFRIAFHEPWVEQLPNFRILQQG